MGRLPVSHAVIGRLIIGIALIGIGLHVNWSRLPSAWAEEGNRVGLVIQHGDGRVTPYCVNFTGETTTGYELLVASGLDLNVDVGGFGTTICRIDNEGCDARADGQCFCQCTSTPCTYWNYWKLENGDWSHSQFGASNRELRNGDVDAWSWSTTGDMADEPESKPPVYSFRDICDSAAVATETAVAAATMTAEAPTATHTPTPTATATSIPATPTPTDTPVPTNTLIPLPVISVLSAEREEIIAGESVVITWETSGADSVALRNPDDSELGLGATGTMTLSPAETSTYTLIARNSGGEDKIPLTITVLPAEAQAAPLTATPTPAAQKTPASEAETTATVIVISAAPMTSTPEQQATEAVIIVDAPPSTSTPTPIAAVAQSAADLATETPMPTATAESVISATPTSAPLATDTPTAAIVSNDIPDSSAPATVAIVAANSVDASAVEAADESQLANIFVGMLFIMAVPLILGLAWMGVRALGSRRQ